MVTNEEIHDFYTDDEESEKLEKLLINDIQQKIYSSAYKYKPNNADYDIFIDEINEGIEFKNDKKAVITKNICIEIGQTLWNMGDESVPSGLLVTKSKYWMQYNQTYWYLAYTERIKKMYYWYMNTVKKNIEILVSSSLTGKELENLERELKKNLMGMRIVYKSPQKQGNGDVKLMDLFLVPEDVFQKICLEIGTLNDLTYKKLV